MRWRNKKVMGEKDESLGENVSEVHHSAFESAYAAPMRIAPASLSKCSCVKKAFGLSDLKSSMK